MSTATLKEWPLWEVFVRSKQGLEHKHCAACMRLIQSTLCKWHATCTPAAKKA